MDDRYNISVSDAVKEIDTKSENQCPGKKTQIVENSENALNSIKIKKYKEEITKLRQANKKREVLSDVLTIISASWLFLTALLFILFGFNLFCVSDAVMITFITSSLATVLGLWIVELKYFFK